MAADGIFRTVVTRDGEAETALTNFAAQIVADLLEDDGLETCRVFEIVATLKGSRSVFRIPAERFAGMSWVTPELGSSALVYPGQQVRDHARAAVQMLSEAECHHVFTHCGWRDVDGQTVFLHGGGAIGPEGPVQSVEVRLQPSLALLVLPNPPDGDELRAAVQASLRLWDLAPPKVTVPCHAGTFAAPLGLSNLTVYLLGPTGTFKTETAALLQQHYGAAFDARHLPGSWTSTDNSLEDLLFLGKDVLVAVDDFVSADSIEQAKLQAKAQRVLRAQGNRSGRQRMRSDGTLRPVRPPRGLVLVTGEDLAKGHSLRARCLVLEVGPGTISKESLTECQHDAAEGLYAAAMAGYVRWLAGRLPKMRRGLDQRCRELREEASRTGGHRRTADIVASLGVALETFIDFAHDAGAIGVEDAARLREQGWQALLAAGDAQAEHHDDAEPAGHFLRLVGAALAAGRAHVASQRGDSKPGLDPTRWGWQRLVSGRSPGECEWRPQGDCIGWIDDHGENIYLASDVALAIAQKLARDQNDSVPVTLRILKKRLHERGFLASVDTSDRWIRYDVRIDIGGRRMRALHIRAALLGEQLGQLGHRDASPTEPAACASPVGGSGLGQAGQQRPTTGPAERARPSRVDGLGQRKRRDGSDLERNGPVGPDRRNDEPEEKDEWAR